MFSVLNIFKYILISFQIIEESLYLLLDVLKIMSRYIICPLIKIILTMKTVKENIFMCVIWPNNNNIITCTGPIWLALLALMPPTMIFKRAGQDRRSEPPTHSYLLKPGLTECSRPCGRTLRYLCWTNPCLDLLLPRAWPPPAPGRVGCSFY